LPERDGRIVSGAMSDTTIAERPPGVDEVSTRRGMGRFDYKWVALTVVLFGTIMTILDSTIVNIAIPTLQRDLHAGSYTDIAWVVTGYLLAQGAVIPLTGWATDRWGTKRLYLITMVTFTVASMLCGISQNLGELIFFRVIQGVGGGMLMPIGMTIILQAVGPQNMGRVMGIFGVPMLLAPAVGPVLGGWFVQDFSWRLIFYVNVPIGIVGFLAAARFLRESHRTAKLRLDVVGLLTGVPAVLALMYAVDRSTTLGWGSPLVVSLLVASAALMFTFVVRQLRAREPLLQLSLFRDRTFSWAMALSFIIVTTMFGTMLLLPLYLQEVHNYNAITTGLLLLPQAAMAAVSMPLGGYLTDRIGPKWVVATGLILLSIGSVVLAQVHYNSSNWLVISALLLRGVAMGFAMMPTMAAAMARVPRRYTSRASSITNTMQRVSSSVGIAILVTVLAGQFSSAAARTGCTPSAAVVSAAAGVLHQPQLTASEYCGILRQSIGASAAQESSGSTQPSTGTAILDSFDHQYAGNVFSDAFDRTFVLIAILSAIGIVPAFFLKRPERDVSGRGAAAEIAA
jgi:EmrB/QacA subfamily drug resistance transporter